MQIQNQKTLTWMANVHRLKAIEDIVKEFTRHLYRIGLDGDYENDADFMMEVYDVLNEVWKELEKREPPTKEEWIELEKGK